MLNPFPTNDCLQARESASALLDGELSELESARLAAHVRDCPACSLYTQEITTIAELLRAAPLEQPELDVTLPQRRALPGLRVAAAAAAVVAVAAGSTVALHRGLASGKGPAAKVVGVPSVIAGQKADSADQRLFAMLRPTQVKKASHQVGRVIFA